VSSRATARIATVGLPAVVVVVTATAVVASVTGGHSSPARSKAPATAVSQQERAAIVDYGKAIVPLVQQGGRVVENGMKPALDDLVYRHITPRAMIVREADAWVGALTNVRGQLATVTPPPSLSEVAPLLDRALASYINAARAFRKAAAHKAGSVRRHFVRVGRHWGETADNVYDRAASLIQGARARAGLPPDVNFPSG
jgi:hypothetical protein